MRAAVLHGARDGDHGTAWSSALLGRGADVNYQDERGRTPLHWAVERGDEEHFDALLDADATLDDLLESVATFEDTLRIARRIFGSAHPLTAQIEQCLQEARDARESA